MYDLCLLDVFMIATLFFLNSNISAIHCIYLTRNKKNINKLVKSRSFFLSSHFMVVQNGNSIFFIKMKICLRHQAHGPLHHQYPHFIQLQQFMVHVQKVYHTNGSYLSLMVNSTVAYTCLNQYQSGQSPNNVNLDP
jgi:hypothetical protein